MTTTSEPDKPKTRSGCRTLATGAAIGCLPGIGLGIALGAFLGVWGWLEYGDELALDPLSDLNVVEDELTLDATRPYVDRLAEEYLATDGNVGLVVAVIEGDQSRVSGYGHLAIDSERVPDGDTIFELASVGKTFTTTVLADMHLQGELNWDDTLQMHLPDGARVPQFEGDAITLLDLATQTSGLPSMPSNFHSDDPLNPYAAYTVDDMYVGVGATPLTARPGTHYEYSNFGFGLLGHVLERRAGTSYEELVIERLCGPLQMHSTRMTLNKELRSRLATPHDGGQPVAVWEDTTMPGAGSFLSTANDMVKYVQAHWPAADGSDGPLSRIAVETTRKRRPADMPSRSMGLGWHIESENALDIIWHNGGAGGSCSYAAFLMEPQVGVVVLSNSSSPVDDIGHTILYLLTRH